LKKDNQAKEKKNRRNKSFKNAKKRNHRKPFQLVGSAGKWGTWVGGQKKRSSPAPGFNTKEGIDEKAGFSF